MIDEHESICRKAALGKTAASLLQIHFDRRFCYSYYEHAYGKYSTITYGSVQFIMMHACDEQYLSNKEMFDKTLLHDINRKHTVREAVANPILGQFLSSPYLAIL